MWLPPPAAILNAGKWLLLLVANPNWMLFFKKLGLRVENRVLMVDVEVYKKSTLMRRPPGLAPLPKPVPPAPPLDLGAVLKPIAYGGLLVGATAGAIKHRDAVPQLVSKLPRPTADTLPRLISKLPKPPKLPAPKPRPPPVVAAPPPPPPPSPPPVVAKPAPTSVPKPPVARKPALSSAAVAASAVPSVSKPAKSAAQAVARKAAPRAAPVMGAAATALASKPAPKPAAPKPSAVPVPSTSVPAAVAAAAPLATRPRARSSPPRLPQLDRTSIRSLYGYLSMLALSIGLMKPLWEHVGGPELLDGASDPQLATLPLMLGSVLAGSLSDRYGRAVVLRVLALGSLATLGASAATLAHGAARCARLVEGYAMLALPVVQAAVADRTGRLLDRGVLFGLLTASSALCMIGGSAASIALLNAATAAVDADGAAPAVAPSLVKGLASAAAVASTGALACTWWLKPPATSVAEGASLSALDAAESAAARAVGGAAGAEAGGFGGAQHNYALQTAASVAAGRAPRRAALLSGPGWLFRGRARAITPLSPSTLAAGLLVLTTVSNPGTFFDVWEGVYNWHKLGGESLLGLAGASLVLVCVQSGLLRPLARAAGGTHRLLCAAHVAMALTFSALMNVDGSSVLSYPMLGAFFSAHSLVDSLTATLVSAYTAPSRQGLAMSLNHAAHLVLLPPTMSTLVMPFINCIVPMLLFPPALRQVRSAVGELAAAIAEG